MDTDANFSQFTGDRITTYLSQISTPVVIMFLSDHFSKEKCDTMQRLCRKIAGEEKYANKVLFWWVNGDEQGNLCRELSVAVFPSLIIFAKGQERIRINCHTSEQAIRYHLDESLKPLKIKSPDLEAAMPWL